MSLEFSFQIETSIDSVGFDECFYNSIDGLRNLHAKKETTEQIYSRVRIVLEKAAKSKNPEEGFVISVTNPEKTKYYGFFLAKNSKKEKGTCRFNLFLFNSIDGSKKWLHACGGELQTPLKNLLESVGAYRWEAAIPKNNLDVGQAVLNITSLPGVIKKQTFGLRPHALAGVVRSRFGWD